MAELTTEAIRAAPKVLLHDHLDGGLRPRTVIELAAEHGYDRLPTTDEADLATWFRAGAARRDLDLYLETFEHTIGVLQTPDALERAAFECAEDLAEDGVVHAEVRFAPELHLQRGLTPDEVVEAVLAGFRRATASRALTVGTLLSAMRHAANSSEIADLALRHRDAGVVGFDIAGREAGHAPTRHLDAFRRVSAANLPITIHAGEASGLTSIWEALQLCGAERLGHGVRIVDDILVGYDGHAELGPLAALVRHRRIPLEMCPSSNVDTGICASIDAHPLRLLAALRFRVTVNTDNRLMSGVTMTSEMEQLVRAFGYGWDDLRWLTINAMKSAFWPYDERRRIIDDVIKPGYAACAGG